MGRVEVNGDVKKALYTVKTGDKILIKYFNRVFNVDVISMPPESVKKEDIEKYIKIVEIKE